VVAAATPFPDPEAAPFLARVRAGLAAGRPPAQALRDARVEWLARDPGSWAAGVLLFEGR